MFWIENKKHCISGIPQFYYIKVGLRVCLFYGHVFLMKNGKQIMEHGGLVVIFWTPIQEVLGLNSSFEHRFVSLSKIH